MPKKKKKIKAAVGAANEQQVATTHGLVTQSINLMLVAGIKEVNKKGGDANIDINMKAIEMGIKWCAHNKIDHADEETKEMKDNVTELERIRQQQRGRVLHTVN